MELKLTHESICINEVVFDSTLDQPVELDYLLPDYCQSIFKVLKCKITPKITSKRIANGKLIIDGMACIKVIYTCEDCYKIKSITSKQMFTKSVDLKESYDNGMVTVYCKSDYVNCRVVNQHRLDIRGAISMKATISVCKKLDILSKASGKGVQINNKRVIALGQKLHVSKEFNIKEELELSYGKPCIAELLDHDASAVVSEYKLIQNKAIVKGEVLLHLLYAGEEEQNPEIMDYTIPISQIVEMPGVSEDYQCVLGFEIISAEINLHSDGETQIKAFEVEFVIRAIIEADRNDEAQLINDIYSTDYNLETSMNKVKLEELVTVINESCIAKSQIEIPQNDIICVYDIMCEFVNPSAKFNEDAIEVAGYMNISLLALDCDNMPIMIERSTACTMRLDCRCCGENMRFSPSITVASVSYSMISSECIEVRADVRVCGNLYRCNYYNVVNSISIDDSCKKPHNDDVAIRLYYAQKGEEVWNIAKSFNSEVGSIMVENGIEREVIQEDGMLLIPN